MKILTAFVLITSLMSSNAEIRATKLTPPIRLNPFQDDLTASPIDFNGDGKVDVRFVYGQGSLSAYFPATNRVVVKIRGNTVGSLPLHTVISGRFPPELNTFRWDNGLPVSSDAPERRQYGERRKIIVSTMMAPRVPERPVFTTTQTNSSAATSSPLGSGDVIGKTGVIAVEFQIDGNVHYGYVHVEFRSDATPNGSIYGFAYETITNTPIAATPLDDTQLRH